MAIKGLLAFEATLPQARDDRVNPLETGDDVCAATRQDGRADRIDNGIASSKMLDQQFGEGSNLSRRMLSGRPDNKHTGRGGRTACHYRDESARSQMVLDDASRKPGDA